MALTGKINPGNPQQEGKEGEEFIATFTNGTVEQLRELFSFLKKEGFTLPEGDDEGEKLASVVRFGISWLERIKESSSKK